MILNSVPYCAPANDGIAGIKIALQIEAIESCLAKWRPFSVSYSHLKIKRLPRQLHAAGLAVHLPIAAHVDTHLVEEVKQPSPRNTKSRVPPAQQQVIYQAAEAKRQRKELQRVIDAGGSVSEEL